MYKGKGKIQKPKVQLKQEEIDTIINYGEYLKGMKDSIEKLKKDYNETIKLQILPSTFEDLIIKTPEGPIKLGELAQCEQKSATLYTIDLIASPEYVKPVFNAIVSSKLHSNPQINSTTISLPIAKVTREHRENLAKTVKAKCEQALKRMREIESKAARKVKESKSGHADLRFNVTQHV
jgi:ribosome recycling factor